MSVAEKKLRFGRLPAYQPEDDQRWNWEDVYMQLMDRPTEWAEMQTYYARHQAQKMGRRFVSRFGNTEYAVRGSTLWVRVWG